MKPALLLASLVLLAGCLDDAPGPSLDASTTETATEPTETVTTPANETTPEPTVFVLDGAYDAVVSGGVTFNPHGEPNVSIPPDTPWIAEVTWDSDFPRDGNMTLAALDGESVRYAQGFSPVRMEVPDGGMNGTVEFQLNPTNDPYASGVVFRVRVSVFDGVPFDPEWSALPE